MLFEIIGLIISIFIVYQLLKDSFTLQTILRVILCLIGTAVGAFCLACVVRFWFGSILGIWLDTLVIFAIAIATAFQMTGIWSDIECFFQQTFGRFNKYGGRY